MATNKEWEIKIDKAVRNAIKGLLIEVIDQPLFYFSEVGLHMKFASKLLEQKDLFKPIKIEGYEEELRVSPLQMEYGVHDQKYARTDISILDPGEIKKIDDWDFKLTDENGRRFIVPLIGIEFGTEKSGSKIYSGEHLKNDAEKIKDCPYGYCINIIRNTNKKFLDKDPKKKKKLDDFKEKYNNFNVQYSNITWIGLIVHFTDWKVEFHTGQEWESFSLKSDRERLERSIDEKLIN